MPKKAKELSARHIRQLTAPGMHPVGGVAGLLLQVTDTGARTWILRYATGQTKTAKSGKPFAVRRDMGLGGFPDVSLAQARELARQYREDIRERGIDPVAERKALIRATRAQQMKHITFADAAGQCHTAKGDEFSSEKHRRDWLSSLERYAFPVLGNMSIADIDTNHIMQVLEPIWKDRTETATRIRQRLETVFSWAIVSGHYQGLNPARWKENLKEVLSKPSKLIKKSNFAALAYSDVPAFIADLRTREGMGARALEFIILTAARSGEVRGATWSEIDLKTKIWTIPASRMKMGKEHKVPLCADAVKLLESLPRESDYLFTAPRGGQLSDMTISAVCKRMKVDAVPHGFRSSFKDWAAEETNHANLVSEMALAHKIGNDVEAAYRRGELMKKRRELMNDWCKFLQKTG